jgi:DNA polymerase I-like protein with 3'-5' exonuclease and polymerase domains
MIPTCFKWVWVLDTEYQPPDGEWPRPICAVAREVRTGKVVQRWLWGQSSPRPPFAVGPDVLVVCYSAWAEWGVYLACDWPLPVRILDLNVEYRWLLSGAKQPSYGLLDAMKDFGLPHMDSQHKRDMRDRCIRGGPFDSAEQRAVLTYCLEDVDHTAALLRAMEGQIDWPMALIRGRYTVAVARMEALGVPLDRDLCSRLFEHREAIRDELIREKGGEYGIYEDGRFDLKAFGAYLARQGIAWPRTEKTGRLSTSEETFEDMLDLYPRLRPLHELRSALGQLKNDGGLTVGADGRNRAHLWPFGTSSGRNAPSTTQFIFGRSTAFRSLIQPRRSWAVAYIDYKQQEFGIAATLSGDRNMIQAYRSGDPYLMFGKQGGLLPADATKDSHGDTRDLLKTCVLGIGYGMGEWSLARRIERPLAYAEQLLNMHRRVYSVYWGWSDKVRDQGMLTGHLETVLGWQVNSRAGPDQYRLSGLARSLRNFPMQAHGAEVLRLACCLATERGIRVVAPVHDALLIEAPAAEIEAGVAATQRAMEEASRDVLGGFTLDTEAKIVRHPDHYQDKRGVKLWASLMKVLAKVETKRSRRRTLFVGKGGGGRWGRVRGWG